MCLPAFQTWEMFSGLRYAGLTPSSPPHSTASATCFFCGIPSFCERVLRCAVHGSVWAARRQTRTPSLRSRSSEVRGCEGRQRYDLHGAAWYHYHQRCCSTTWCATPSRPQQCPRVAQKTGFLNSGAFFVLTHPADDSSFPCLSHP